MSIKRIIRIKEGIKELRARELLQIEANIRLLEREIDSLEKEASRVNEEAKNSFSEALYAKYMALVARKKELQAKLLQLRSIREEKREKLKEAYRDIKALEIVKERREELERARNLNIELQNTGFLHLVRQFYRNG